MKFLIDRCAGSTLARWLRERGHDVVESRTLGADPGDLALLQIAAPEKRTLITIDTDFGKLIYLGGEDHCGIVRLPDVPATRRIAIMEMLLANHPAELSDGSIITVRGDRVRITKRPRI
jgi:predicted nuclease of predicted toxin-antitoxin system